MSAGRKRPAAGDPDRQPGGAPVAAASATELQACVRDLMSLIALPALTGGNDLDDILGRYAEALGALLPIRFCVLGASGFSDSGPNVAVWRPGEPTGAPADAAWRDYGTAVLGVSGSQLQAGVEDTPLGTMQVVKMALGYGQDTGALAVGADDATFPSLTQSALLRAAASLAAGRIKGARLVHEREQADRVKDEFLAMLGHELRNPLAPIVTTLDLLRLRRGGSATREEEIIRRQVDHLIRMVDDLLDVSRVARGKVELRNTTVEVAGVLDNAVEMASVLLEQRGHHLEIDYPRSGLRVTGDPTRLAQVVANLLTNAARYTEPGGTIWLRAWRDGSEVAVSVRDNGIGMDPELVPRVFDLFVQGQRAGLDRAGGGLGLGLALVKSLVQMHGGRVEARSDGRGNGSEFTVRLPLPVGPAAAEADVAPPAVAAAAAVVARAGGGAAHAARILLVDDNADGADAMAMVLEAVGHEVLVAYNPVTALTRCAEFRPQVAVLDIGMPVMDGYELARRMRELPELHATTLVAMTGYGQAADAEQARQAGFAVHLVKPVDPQTLIELVDRLTAAPRQTAA